MERDNESFEEMQRRITGSPPSLGQRIRMLIKQTNWSKVIFPAVFIAVFATTLLRDVFEDRELPDYVFAIAAITLFIAVFVLLTIRESTGKRNSSRGSTTE